MSSKLNVDSFLAVLKKSGLIESDRLQKSLRELDTGDVGSGSSVKLAEKLISSGIITRWQSEKLLQGKSKGYFLGKYRLLSLLGKGGMSSVYLAEHMVMKRRCALKVLPHKRVNDSSYLARFHREAQAVATLDHPNIVRAYDVDQQSDRDTEIHFLVMEYVEGPSLQELVQRNGVCGFCDAVDYIRQSALGLQHAHENGMVHRDVKPGNLLVDPTGTVKVLDLGLAMFFTAEEGDDALTIQHDEKVLGTADYLAPEQALDSHTVDARADIYSLGCTLYFLLTGRPPFIEGTLTQRLMAHQTKTPPAIESLRQDMPASLAAIVRKMMAKKAEDRYQTAKENAAALLDWLKGNADAAWRQAHPGVVGDRTGSGNVLVAKPVVAVPVANVPAPTVPQPAASPMPAKPTAGPVVESEINSFFATLSQSHIGGGGKSSLNLKKAAEAMTAAIAEQNAATAPKSKDTVAAAETTVVSAATNPAIPSPAVANKAPAVKTTSPPVSAPAVTPDPNDLFGIFPDQQATASSPLETDVAYDEESSPPAKPAIKQQAKPFDPKSPVVLGGVVAMALVLLGVAYAIGLFDGLTGSGSGGGSAKWKSSRREVTVGQDGEFKSIIEALKAVRANYEPDPDKPEDTLTVKVASGIYRERISISAKGRLPESKGTKGGTDRDWPEGIRIVADGDVTLEPDGDQPVIRLNQATRFAIEGMTINAKGKRNAIELSGTMPRSRLSNLKIQGFSKTGILCKGVVGSSAGSAKEEFLLEHIRLESGGDGSHSIGIRFEDSDQDSTSDVRVNGSRILGPMGAGIAVAGLKPFNIAITANVISAAEAGIRFDGSGQWRDISIVNNTIHNGQHGILFFRPPGEGTGGLVIRRNLFSQLSVAEGWMQGGYDEAKFKSMQRSKGEPDSNWSDRAAPAKPGTGEIGHLFVQNGKRGEKKFAFASVDPKADNFLAPTGASVQKSVAGANAELGELGWVGAVGP